MEPQKKELDFLDISPYVRYVHRCLDADRNNHQVPWRYIYDYECLFIIQGSIDYITEQENVRLTAHDIHIIPPLVWHRTEIPDKASCSYYSVHFDFVNLGQENDFSPEEVYIAHCNADLQNAPVDDRLFRRPLYTLGSLQLPHKMRVNDPVAYTELLNHMVKAWAERYFAYEIDLKCDMLRLLKQILYDVRLRIVGAAGANMDNLSAITQYVLEHFNEQISFAAICRVYGYSYSNFRKLFKRKSGKSPHEFLTDLRMEKAVELLYSRKYTITQIASMVGYGDCAYFSRVFHQKKGCSPSAFVKTC